MGDEIRGQSADLSTFVLENIRGLDETIQYGNGEKRMYQMNRKTKSLSEKQSRMSKLTGINLAIANSFILVFDAAMLILAFYLYRNGNVDLAGMLIPVIAFMSSFGPVTALANLGTTLQNTIASGGRVLAIMDETPETEDISGQPEISFSGASLMKMSHLAMEEKRFCVISA